MIIYRKSFNTKITEEVDKSIDSSRADLRRELTEATNIIRDKLGSSYVLYESSKILNAFNCYILYAIVLFPVPLPVN